ncbi:Guanine deaminase [compost metagenome]
MCLSAVYWAKIDFIYYANTKQDADDIGFSDKFIYDELDKPMNERQLPIKQMMRDEAIKAFKLWAQSPLRITY